MSYIHFFFRTLAHDGFMGFSVCAQKYYITLKAQHLNVFIINDLKCRIYTIEPLNNTAITTVLLPDICEDLHQSQKNSPAHSQIYFRLHLQELQRIIRSNLFP